MEMKFKAILLGAAVFMASLSLADAMEERESKLESKDGTFGLIEKLEIDPGLRETGEAFTKICNGTTGPVECRVFYAYTLSDKKMELSGDFSVRIPGRSMVTFTPHNVPPIKFYSIYAVYGTGEYFDENVKIPLEEKAKYVWHLYFTPSGQLEKEFSLKFKKPKQVFIHVKKFPEVKEFLEEIKTIETVPFSFFEDDYLF